MPAFAPPARAPASPKVSKRAPHSRLTSSALGLPDMTYEERRAARVPIFDLLGVSRISRGIYLDAFYTTIDDEYGGFARLPYRRDAKQAIARRVAAAIRIIAAFSAWYPVIWRFVAAGFIVANVAAAAAGIFLAYDRLQAAFAPVSAGFGAACIVIAVVVTSRVSPMLPRNWPYDMLALLFIGASFASAAQFAARTAEWWSVGAVAGMAAIAVFCAVNLVVLTLSQAMTQFVTWRKINAFPEEEVIETTAAVLVGLHTTDSWRLPEQRARHSDNMGWAARRIERELISRYVVGLAGTNESIRSDAAAYAAAYRAIATELVFPSDSVPAKVRAFLWDALQKEATGCWGLLERAAPAVAMAQRRARVLAALGSLVSIALPLAIAAIAFRRGIPGVDDAFQTNIGITALGWSVLSVLAILNPRQFDQQASAAKTLGDVLKQGRS